MLEMKEIVIGTPYGNAYVLDEQGRVLEYSNGLNKRNATEEQKNTWIITGAWFYKSFGRMGFLSFAELLKLQSDTLVLKNGKPKYGLRDIDHGTSRIHGNKDVHGISYIYTKEVQ
jgi:hypothetical protein